MNIIIVRKIDNKDMQSDINKYNNYLSLFNNPDRHKLIHWYQKIFRYFLP